MVNDDDDKGVMMNGIPPVMRETYNRKQYGHYGELGDGANAKIRYLLTALSAGELDYLTLIENIPGSEKWDVRDLFQRDVDKERVTREILPYLKDEEKVKFFNPLTLALLPLDENGSEILRNLVCAQSGTVKENGYEIEQHEFPGFFQFQCYSENPAFSNVQWNDQKVKLVAIDGQHRLSALKRWKNEPNGSAHLRSWHIPVVILGIFRLDGDAPSANVLEIVRKTFVYINTYAEQVNEARKILLNDESVNCIAVQEIVQSSHRNDSRMLGSRNESRLPLLFFDWRGETSGRQRIEGPAAIKTIEEVHGWFQYYLLGGDGDDSQSQALQIDEMVPAIRSFGKNKKLTHEDAARVRTQVGKVFLPGFSYLLENFDPYQQYIAKVRAIEREACARSDAFGHAFQKVRFGTHRAGEDLIDAVTEAYHEIIEDLEEVKNGLLDELLARDIGMRAIMASYAGLKTFYDEATDKTNDYLEYSHWFLPGLNAVYDQGWLRSFDSLTREEKNLLIHIAFSPSGEIVNYKFDDVRSGLGALLSLIISVECDDVNLDFDDLWNDVGENLRTPLRRGFRKEVRAELQESFEGTIDEFKRKVNEETNRRVSEKMDEIMEIVL